MGSFNGVWRMKPTATYETVVFKEVSPLGFTGELDAQQPLRIAIVTNCKHPLLGYEGMVYTSLVVSGDEHGFETLNTTYRPV
jgi:hypothetical protein